MVWYDKEQEQGKEKEDLLVGTILVLKVHDFLVGEGEGGHVVNG